MKESNVVDVKNGAVRHALSRTAIFTTHVHCLRVMRPSGLHRAIRNGECVVAWRVTRRGL